MFCPCRDSPSAGGIENRLNGAVKEDATSLKYRGLAPLHTAPAALGGMNLFDEPVFNLPEPTRRQLQPMMGKPAPAPILPIPAYGGSQRQIAPIRR